MSASYNDHGGEWFAPLPDNVTIGERSYLYSSYAFRHCPPDGTWTVSIGHDSGDFPNTCFELGPHREVSVGDYCTLADPIIATAGRVRIGSYCMIGWETVIAGSSYVVPSASRETLGTDSDAEIVLADNVWVGARAILLGGARIGEGSVIGAGSVIDFEVPPCSIAAGNPGRVIGPIGGRPR